MSLDWMNYSAEPCYVCGRKLGKKTPHVAYLEDDDNAPVFVGSECIGKIAQSGLAGMRGGKGKGPLVFSTVEQARCFARTRHMVTS